MKLSRITKDCQRLKDESVIALPALVDPEELVDKVAGADDEAGERDDEQALFLCPDRVVAKEQDGARDG